jgi:hypothetical protein
MTAIFIGIPLDVDTTAVHTGLPREKPQEFVDVRELRRCSRRSPDEPACGP